MESKPSDLANGGQISWSPNLQIWQTEIGYYGVQTFRFGKRRSVMESKPSDLAIGNLVTSKSKGLDSKKTKNLVTSKSEGLDSKKFIESFYVVSECLEIPR